MSCSGQQVRRKRSVGGWFLAHFFHLELRQIQTTATPLSRGVGLLMRTGRRSILRETQPDVMILVEVTVTLRHARPSRRSKRSVLN